MRQISFTGQRLGSVGGAHERLGATMAQCRLHAPLMAQPKWPSSGGSRCPSYQTIHIRLSRVPPDGYLENDV